jgi:hypothetical protein
MLLALIFLLAAAPISAACSAMLIIRGWCGWWRWCKWELPGEPAAGGDERLSRCGG